MDTSGPSATPASGRGVPRRGRIAADPWVRHLAEHVPIARAGLDPEGSHQIRVAVAHLRVWLTLSGLHVLDDDLRWLRDAMARIRDLDIQFGHDPPPAWAATLQRHHVRAQRALRGALDDDRLASLLVALSLLPPAPRARARAMIPEMARRALARGRFMQRHRGDPEALHRLRRAVRRLRFALEWLGEDATSLAKVQESLGEACDCTVALRELGRWRGEGVRGYRARLKEELRRATRDARAKFRRVRPWLEALACNSS